MSGFDNQTMFANNVDFTGNANVQPQVLLNGQLLIGSTLTPHIEVGTLTSPLGTIAIGYSKPNITLDVTGGTIAMEKIAVDASTSPGTNPVLPTSGGVITMTGNQVAAGTVGAHVIRTDSLAANTLTVEIQRSTSAATSTVADNGVAHFDSAQFLVDSNAFVTTTKFNTPGVANLGITNTSGTTLTVNSSSGAALSSTNPAYVTLQSLANPGQLITYAITANQSFTQAQLANNLFGITTGINVAVDMPFYLYAVSNANNGENTIAFMISRIPHRTIAPVAGNIGQSGNTLASTQGSFFSLKAITAADYASSPCLCIGSFRMQYSGGSTVWTIQTLNNSDGIGQYQDQIEFAFPPGQFGANTANYFTTASAPTFATPVHNYQVKRDGLVFGYSAFGNSTNGSNASNLTIALPFVVGSQGASFGYSLISTVYSALTMISGSAGNVFTFAYANNGGTGLLLNNTMVNGSFLGGNYFCVMVTA